MPRSRGNSERHSSRPEHTAHDITMKELIDNIRGLTFTLSSVNRAKLVANGEVTTGGWTGGELTNPRMGDGILHLDFVAQPPAGPSTDAIEEIDATYLQMLAGQPQDVTVHTTHNEMSVRLPAAGDPP
jgi:hypothetical protein